MNDTFASKLTSFRAALTVADEAQFTPVWQGKPPAAFEENLTAARATIDALASKGALQSQPTTGASDGLRQIRAAFEAALLQVARAVNLAEPLTVAPAQNQPAPGVKFGITTQSVAALDAAWQRYSAPAGARSQRKTLTEQLPNDFRNAEEEFAALDDLILQFDDGGGTGTRFIDSWFNARRVQDTGRRSARPAPAPAQEASAPAAPSTASPAPKASQ